MPLEKALKPKAVAELLDIHIDRYYELAKRGEIPAFRLGREWRTDAEQLRKFMAGEWKPTPKRKPGKPLRDYSHLEDLITRGPSLH